MRRTLIGWTAAVALGASLIVGLTMRSLPTEPLTEGVEVKTAGPLIELLHHPRDTAPAGTGIRAGGIITGPPGGPAEESERGGPRVLPLASEPRLDR